MRRAAKVDANQPEIVKQLRKLGISVEVNHDDIFCGYRGINFWYEIKNPDKVSKTGKARKQPSQTRLEKEWKGHYKIVSSLDEILADIGINVN